MTRSPILSTVISLTPLAALTIPLVKVLHSQPAAPVAREAATAPVGTLRCHLSLFSAHPPKSLILYQGSTSHSLEPEFGEFDGPLALNADGSLTLQIEAIWPEGTPETALRIELSPGTQPMQTRTIWGLGQVREELDFPLSPES